MGIGRLKLRMTLRQRKALTGVAFSSPFIVGFVCFFLYPLIQSFAFSLSEIKLTQTGYETRFIGLQSYRHALFVDASSSAHLSATAACSQPCRPF